jgi:HD-like signal output (HDOD) protein
MARAERKTVMKKRIYVVDDQAPVMETAVLVLRSIDPQWEVTGFKDPYLALAAIKTKAPDLVLADQIMPEMQGSQLLESVRTISPTTIRIIMSGYVALNRVSLITSAHQYLAKPFDAVKLKETIRRSFAAQERISDKGLQAVATALRSIPSLPQTYHALLRELQSDRTAVTNIARLVAEDAGLTVKVLQLANSPLFGHNELISRPFDAVMCLGTEMIMAMVFAQSMFRHYESLLAGEVDLRQVWSHCWQTAYLAQHVCNERKFPRLAGEEAFMAGLLHETGRFILADNFPDQFQAACQAARQAKSPLAPQLREVFHTSPVQVAAYVLELWGLPASLISAIALQDDPVADQAYGFTLASALYVADGIASRQTPPDPFPPQEWNTAYLQAVGCLESMPDWETFSMGQKPGASQ